MLLISALAACWLFVIVLSMALMRSAALADADAERERRETGQGRARAAAVAVAVAVPIAAAAASDAGAQSATTPCPGAEAAPDPAHLGPAREATLCLINAERRERELAALDFDPRLIRAAERHSADMVDRGYFSHVSLGGSTFVDRLRRTGYFGRCSWRAGETLAWGSGVSLTPASRVSAWMASRPHREVLLDPGYRDVGVGIAAGTPARAGSGFTYSAELGRRRC